MASRECSATRRGSSAGTREKGESRARTRTSYTPVALGKRPSVHKTRVRSRECSSAVEAQVPFAVVSLPRRHLQERAACAQVRERESGKAGKREIVRVSVCACEKEWFSIEMRWEERTQLAWKWL
jgi:hypothetical protein